MPRSYKRKPGARQYKNYTEETLLKALGECKNESVKLKDVSKIYNIPIRTLRNKLKGAHSKSVGGQTVLSLDLEETILAHILKCSDYGMPLTSDDIRCMVKMTLDQLKMTISKFTSNLPGIDWVKNFLSRHKDELSLRNCQNIKRTRAEVDNELIEKYFNNLTKTLDGVPPDNILNYDETNLSDEPGQKRCVFRRGIKYPERVINYSKGNISVMFSGTASGVLLPPYIIYKAIHLYESWREHGPPGSRFGRSKNGWMDSQNFTEWFNTIVVPWARKQEGVKALIGDNLSSHISPGVIEKCEQLNIAFVLLPPNATDKLQPLDVSYFAPLKKQWRKQLEEYRRKFPSSTSLDKSLFPCMLNKLIDSLSMRSSQNLISGFRACGIVPLDRREVLKKFASSQPTSETAKVSEAVLDYLHQFKYSPNGNGSTTSKRKRVRVPVSPGKSLSTIRPSPREEQSDPASSSSSSNDQPCTSAFAQTSAQDDTDSESNNQPNPTAFVQTSLQHETDSSNSGTDSEILTDISDDDEEWIPKPTKIPRKTLF